MTNPTVLRRRKCGRWDTPASIRVMQFMLSTTYLVLIVYSYVHRGWWMYRKLLKVLALGLGTSLLSLAVIGIYIMTWFSSIKLRANNLFSEKVVRVFSYSVDHIIGTLWLAMFALSLLPKGKDFKHLFDTPPYSTYSTAAAIAVVLSALFYWTGLFTCNPPDPEAFLGPLRPHDFERLGIVEGAPDPPYWRRAMERRAMAEAATRPTTATTAPTSNSDPDAIELQDMNVPNRPRANASSRAIVYN